MSRVMPWWLRYLKILDADGAVYNTTLDEYRWMVEEYRVSLFAQSLGTAVKVSEKRLAAAWRRVGADG
jgi:ATP-dependent helicase HrpA